MSNIAVRSWYISSQRLLELLNAEQLPESILRALSFPNHHYSRAILANALGTQLLKFLRAEGVLPLYRLVTEGLHAPGAWFTYDGHLYGKGFGASNRSNNVSLSISISDILPGKKLIIDFSKSGITTDTAYTRLNGSQRLFAFCTITSISNDAIHAIPYVIGDLIERSNSTIDLRLTLKTRLNVQSIDQFKNTNFLWRPSPKTFDRLRNISEQQVKELFCRLLGENFVPKDWGGEECDIFSSNLSVDGTKYRAAFLLKGPAKFHEMTMADCGKNGDQIYRLFNTPADIYVVQHCHKITPAVQKTVEAFALSNYSTGCMYTLIDGYDTARILHSNGIL